MNEINLVSTNIQNMSCAKTSKQANKYTKKTKIPGKRTEKYDKF